MDFSMLETGLLVLLVGHAEHVECLLVCSFVQMLEFHNAIGKHSKIFAEIHLEVATSILG